MQYIISIGLVIGALTIHAQLKLTQKKGECYRNLIEIGSWKGGKLDVNTFAAELKNRPEIASVTRAGGSLLFAWLQQIIVENKDGSESYYSSVQYMGEEDLLQTLNLQIHQGLAPREAMQKYDQPVYINRRYADILIPAGENPVGQLVSRYDKSFQNVLAGDPKQACTICGIVSDLYINTLEEEAMPSLIYLNNAGNQHYRTLYVRLNEKQKKEGMETLQAVWKKVNPNEYFTYIDVYEVFMQTQPQDDRYGELIADVFHHQYPPDLLRPVWNGFVRDQTADQRDRHPKGEWSQHTKHHVTTDPTVRQMDSSGIRDCNTSCLGTAEPLAGKFRQPDKHFPTLFPNGRRHRPGHHITNGRMAQLPGSFEQPGKKPKE